uniref:Myosin motor domain-containing protein n=1 Tax=Echinostoma caproni TaxID=27848 RepID=A0A183BGP2_9TREM
LVNNVEQCRQQKSVLYRLFFFTITSVQFLLTHNPPFEYRDFGRRNGSL